MSCCGGGARIEAALYLGAQDAGSDLSGLFWVDVEIDELFLWDDVEGCCIAGASLGDGGTLVGEYVRLEEGDGMAEASDLLRGIDAGEAMGGG